jgi:hypothetical protein
MMTKYFKRFAPSATALALVGMLLLGPGSTARAHAADTGSHNLEGAWRLQVTVLDCQTGTVIRTFPALATFAKGGTVTITSAGQPPSLTTTLLGVWRHEDQNYSAVSEAFIFSPAGVWIQTHRLTRNIKISDDGNGFTDTLGLEIFGTNGNLIVTGCGTTVATRFK